MCLNENLKALRAAANVEAMTDVQKITMESNGTVSVVKRRGGDLKNRGSIHVREFENHPPITGAECFFSVQTIYLMPFSRIPFFTFTAFSPFLPSETSTPIKISFSIIGFTT